MNEKSFHPTVDITTEKYQENIKYLKEKIDNIKKEISYFDAYNITDVVTDSKTFPHQLSSLLPNHSLIINTETSFSYNEVIYSRGDILLKQSNGKIIHIKAQTGGVYYPSEMVGSNGTYTITYLYSPVPPSDADNADVKKQYTFKNITSLAPETIYGLCEKITNGEYSFNKIEEIQPIIQFFLVEDEIPGEQIIIDYKLTSNDSNTWVVNIEDTSNTYFIKVK